MMYNLRFDHDWFSNNINNLSHLHNNLPILKNPDLNILELGAFEGRSTVYMAMKYPQAHITTVDTWRGGVDHDPNNPEINFAKAKSNFYHNIQSFETRISVMEQTTEAALIELMAAKERFDFVYVDASHTAKDVLQDLVMSFTLLNDHAVVYCDDYLWGVNDYYYNGNRHSNPYITPKLGIDMFCTVYRDLIFIPILKDSHAMAFIRLPAP